MSRHLCRNILLIAVALLLVPSPATSTAVGLRQRRSGTIGKDAFTFLVSGGYREPEAMKYASYMVSVRSRTPRKFFGDNHFCAGTIIGPSTILTAGHCVMDRRKVLTRPRRLLVVAGTPNRLNIVNTTVQFPVHSVTAHPKFMRNNIDDIAIIRIKGSIPTDNENIKVMTLPTKPPPYGESCLTLGWGRLYYNGPLSATPTHISLRLFTVEECQVRHPRWTEGTLCAADAVLYNEDPCRGDSGGPLICNNELTGIVSWTVGCGSKQYPSLYTDVYFNLEWIKANIDQAHAVRPSHFIIISVVLFQFKLQALALHKCCL